MLNQIHGKRLAAEYPWQAMIMPAVKIIISADLA